MTRSVVALLPSKNTRHIVRALLRWYGHHGRALAWRQTRLPYRILVSEIMLQQTQVQRVREAYPRFLRRFPSLRILASAPLREVLIAWRGLGYNSRAVRLHALARQVVQQGGRFPRTLSSLQALPGVGRYTAHALLAFAFGQVVPVVDTNVRRVLSRLFWTMPSPEARQPESLIWALAGYIVPRESPFEWNQALMDLGALVCTSRRPRCTACPVASFCRSRRSMGRAARREPRREPSFQGIPRRIYRGRIVEELRSLPPGATLSAPELGGRLVPKFSSRNLKWFETVLWGLARDGVLEVDAKGPKRTLEVKLVQ